MKAIQILEPGRAELVELPEPGPLRGEVLVKVMAVTTCPQWDMHVFRGVPMFVGQEITYPYTPGQPGHEMAGVVAALGGGATGFEEGDRVVAWRDPGHERPGCYAEYVCFDQRDLLPLPEGGRFAAYAPLELAMCVGASFIDVLGTTRLEGKRVGISGLGSSGLIAAQYARAEGASEIVGFEPNVARAEVARSFGVDRVLDPLTTAPEELTVEGRRPVDVSLDCVGSKASAEYLLGVTREVVAIFGVQRESYAFPAGSGGLKLFGYPGHTRRAAEYAITKVSSGACRLDGLVGESMGLGEYVRAVEMLERQEALKVCFLPHGPESNG